MRILSRYNISAGNSRHYQSSPDASRMYLATTSTTAAHGCCGGQQFERREAGFERRRR
jgi:hypothetical protein